MSALSLELFLRSSLPFGRMGKTVDPSSQAALGLVSQAPSLSVLLLYPFKVVFIPRTDLAHQVPALPCREETENQA